LPVIFFILFNTQETLSVEEKITDLEIRLTHQEAAIEEMNGVLLKQHQLIESLRAELATLQRQLIDMGTSNVGDVSQEPPPPHY
jgi:SlyX protein